MITLESVKTNDGKSNMSSFWGFQTVNMKYSVANTGSFKNFENQEFIRNLMIKNIDEKDIEEIECSKYFDATDRNKNLMYHALHLKRFFEHIESDLNKVESIFELGGGYGALCRLIFNLGYENPYTILDLPIFSELQKYYLTEKLHDSKISMKKYADVSREVYLFISMWAISETPFEYRRRILDKVHFKKCMIAFQKEFGTEDVEEYNNLKYFKNMIKEYPDYNWYMSRIKNIPNNYYLFGEVK